jgi:hypothetical protein
LSSEQYPSSIFVHFVGTFRRDDRPEVLSMSGGEALLRPELVRELADTARLVGTRSSVLSGMFFATSRRIPPSIRRAIRALDHFSVSLDTFHEREVPRANVFRVLDELLSDGTDVSIHLVGINRTDPYIDIVVSEVQRLFGDKVPLLVNVVASFGRAAAWLSPASASSPLRVDAEPCAMAAWPVVGFDGTIVACGNDRALEVLPSHLRLGHANRDDWATVRARCLGSSTLRAIRLFGPEYLAERFREGWVECEGYCQTCMKLLHERPLEQGIARMMAAPSAAVLENQASAMQTRAGALGFARRYALPGYANLVALGASA